MRAAQARLSGSAPHGRAARFGLRRPRRAGTATTARSPAPRPPRRLEAVGGGRAQARPGPRVAVPASPQRRHTRHPGGVPMPGPAVRCPACGQALFTVDESAWPVRVVPVGPAPPTTPDGYSPADETRFSLGVRAGDARRLREVSAGSARGRQPPPPSSPRPAQDARRDNPARTRRRGRAGWRPRGTTSPSSP